MARQYNMHSQLGEVLNELGDVISDICIIFPFIIIPGINPLIIVLFGGPVLEAFALTMLIGFIVGTYSSIYIASSFVIWYNERNKKVELSK